ncbi:MAG TPA: glycerophosphodiester phosphodiesterase family protein [Microlunatus sp.]|nr:glycerophosphodiester phosphodiesterase family protein [Microlunatus sp.]
MTRWTSSGSEAPLGRFSRRAFLAGAIGAGLAVAGCASSGVPQSGPPATVTSLLVDSPFYIAHRGGGGNWPEMTAYAYDQATQLPGLKAIEISVCLTADGVLVCSHDPTTRRVTGVDYEIRSEQWSTLAPLMVTPVYTTDPTQPARPFSRFDEVIEAHLDRFVAFVEPKTPEAVEPLMAKLVSMGQPERVVWKQPVNQENFGRAKSHGFGTWGYVLDEPGHTDPTRLARFAASPDIDLLGVQRIQPDGFVSTIVGAASDNGKKTIMWEIRSSEDRARALALGCTGMMTSNIAQVPQQPL